MKIPETTMASFGPQVSKNTILKFWPTEQKFLVPWAQQYGDQNHVTYGGDASFL